MTTPSFEFGRTSIGLPIPAYRFTGNGPEVLILGGVHGDEIEGVTAALGLLGDLMKTYPYKLNLTLVPALNLDGVMRQTRTNARGVDLNRNLPTKDWSSEIVKERYHPGPNAGSEPENQAIIKFLEKTKVEFIISLHSWKPMLNVNGDCLPEAEAIQKVCGYRIDADIGYPTPGCLGTYSGLERNIPTITYEVEHGLEAKKVLELHLPSLHAGLKKAEERRKK